MTDFIKDVLRISTRTKGRNSWKVLTTRAEDGKERDENLILANDQVKQRQLENLFSSPGKYKFTYQKQDSFWVITDAQRIGPAESDQKSAQYIPPTTTALHAGHNGHVVTQSVSPDIIKREIAGLALMAVSHLVAGMAQGGSFKDATADQIKAFTLEAFDALAKRAAEFIQGKPADKPTTAEGA